MRAMVMREQGPPSVLKLENIDIPVPAPDEVLVKVGAVGVSYHDVVERNGVYQRGLTFPRIMGYEIAGTVERIGALVTTLKPGDRVCSKAVSSCGLCRYCRNGMETACRKRKGVRGGYAEYAAVAEEAMVKIPDSLPYRIACQLGAATGVALNAVRDVARVNLTDTVLVTGASGGLGLPTIEIAKLAGAKVIALTRSEAKRAPLIEAGADHVVIANEQGDFAKEVMTITNGVGASVVIDNVGSRVFTQGFKALAVGGRYTLVGQLFREEVSINPARIFFKRAHILGVGSVRRDQLEDAIMLAAEGRVRPRVARVFKLEQAPEAHALVEGGEMIGRVVLEP